MCTYIVEKAAIVGSAKGPSGWMTVDTANVYYDHPYHAPLDHALNIDFVHQATGARERVAVELSAESALDLIGAILAALESGVEAHGDEENGARRRDLFAQYSSRAAAMSGGVSAPLP